MRHQGRFLGLDFGERYIGVAISDESAIIAQCLEVIDTDQVNVWERLDQICAEYQLSGIVVGLARNMNGSKGMRAKQCEAFANCLEERYPEISVELWDERLSSVAATRMLKEVGQREKKRRVRDKIAAAWILQAYLDGTRRCLL
ncbi:MAG: hypothetical protein RLZ12_20 [Bacillota bacterium]|jgi:putative Holliday junction resolvase